jgi:hypothetical protein
LARYNGRLSRFFDDVVEWADGVRAAPPYDGDLLQSYIKDIWGYEDYILSLVRYMLAATDPARARYTTTGRHRPPRCATYSRKVAEIAAVGPAWDTGPTETRLQLSPDAAVLTDMHLCPEILAILDKAETPETVTVPTELLGPRLSYVLLPGDSTRPVRNLAISDDAACMLNFLEKARHKNTIAAYLGAPEHEMSRLNEFLDELVAMRVLRSIPAANQHAREAVVVHASVAGI